jgi:hypothetical protein
MQNLGNKSKVTAIIAIVLLMASAMFVTMQVKPAQGLPPPSAMQPYIGALRPGDVPNATFWDGSTVAALSFSPPDVIGTLQVPLRTTLFLKEAT